MAKKKDKRTTAGSNLPALKIGSRVRCTDDGVEGRIVWANGVAVKIQWANGEQVTWKRDTLAGQRFQTQGLKGDRRLAVLAVVVHPRHQQTNDPRLLVGSH